MDASCSKIAAGEEFSLFVVDRPDSSQVLACGHGQWGQLGHGGVMTLGYAHTQRFITLNRTRFVSNLCLDSQNMMRQYKKQSQSGYRDYLQDLHMPALY